MQLEKMTCYFCTKILYNHFEKSPGIVIGKDNNQISVKHGGQCIRVHPCRLQLKTENDQLNIQPVSACKFNNKPNELNAVEPENSDINIFEITDEEIVSVNNSMTNEDISDPTNSISNLSLNKEITESENSDNETDNIINPIKLTGLLPKINSKIVYHNPETQSWNEALVLSRAGKSTGRNRTWLNTKNLGDDYHQSVDFSSIKDWQNVEEEVLVTSYSDTNIDILRAKSAELKNWQKHHVYDEVDDIGQTTVSVRWVVSQKYKNRMLPTRQD